MPQSESKPKVLFILSVDTEEEWDWSGPFPEENFSLENTRNIPVFQKFCNSLGIRPTYFVDYAIANDQRSSKLLREILASGKCEIGGHLHPWCNPPFEEIVDEERSHVVNLPIDLVERKIEYLNNKIEQVLGIKPNSFRTGRWGINGPVLKLLNKKGYNIDSSVYPYYSNKYFSCHNFPNEPYWPNLNNPTQHGEQREICEIPVTAGFNRSNFKLMSKLHKAVSSTPWSFFKPIGILWRLGILRKIYLSPELSSAKDMLALVTKALASNQRVIHMYIHSSSLRPGCNHFVKNNSDEKQLYDDIKTIVKFLQEENDVEFCTITEAANRLRGSH
jgi:hypothetical protein